MAPYSPQRTADLRRVSMSRRGIMYRPKRHQFGLALSIATSAALLGSATGFAFGVVSVSDASAGTSLFSTCQNLGPSNGGTNYPQTELEPRIAVSPFNHDHIISVYQQD